MFRLAILVVAVALPLFAASPAQALRSEFYGIGDGSIDEQDRQGMENANVHSERFMLKWRDIEPTKDVYDWDVKDHFIGGLAAHGIRPIPFVWGSPTWVGSGANAQPPTATTADQQQWQQFLKDAVRRYGPNGTYWNTEYKQQFPGATPLPVTTWQIWNEPNLKKFFAPGATVQASAQKYVTLLRLSDSAIATVDPKAMILLAGMPGQGDSTAWVFLSNIYKVAGSKAYFDGAAMHPYSCTVTQVGNEMKQFRNVMVANNDSATPVWVTEFAWGSGPEDQFCKNYGETGQRDRLTQSYKLFLTNRKAWNLQRLFWYLWRDPPAGSPAFRLCSICGTAGLLRNNRTAKPAMAAFKSFTLDSTPPIATINLGPAAGSFTNDPTPTFTFSSNEIGSTFICHYDSNPFGNCNSPNTRTTRLTDGVHTFYVKAVDPVGNESLVKTRSFTVDTVPPNTTITSGVANGGVTTDHTPTFGYASSQAGSTFKCRFDAQTFGACSGPGNTHTPSTALTSGSHSFEVKATDKAGNVDPTAAKRTFTIAP